MVNHANGATSGAVAHVGATLDLKTQAGRSFTITLKQVVDPATATNGKSAPSGKRFIATVFGLDNPSGQTVSTDGDLDANLVGSNGTSYLPNHRSLSECDSHTPPGATGRGQVGDELRVVPGAHVGEDHQSAVLSGGGLGVGLRRVARPLI